MLIIHRSLLHSQKIINSAHFLTQKEKKMKLTFYDVISILTALLTALLLKDYGHLKSELWKEAEKFNNTIKANQTILVFNRTPKAGSESLWKLIDNLAFRNNFTSMSDDPENKKIRGENTFLRDVSSRKYYVTGLLDQPNSTTEEASI